MNAIPFDTHRVVKRLKEAGFSKPQAETVTDVLREARDTELSALATKADLATATAELKAGTQLLRGEMLGLADKLRAEIADSRAETLKWMIGLLLVQGGLIVGLSRLLPGH